jgi:hypothetical protein
VPLPFLFRELPFPSSLPNVWLMFSSVEAHCVVLERSKKSGEQGGEGAVGSGGQMAEDD